jgi:hypothetical protein
MALTAVATRLLSREARKFGTAQAVSMPMMATVIINSARATPSQLYKSNTIWSAWLSFPFARIVAAIDVMTLDSSSICPSPRGFLPIGRTTLQQYPLLA